MIIKSMIVQFQTQCKQWQPDRWLKNKNPSVKWKITLRNSATIWGSRAENNGRKDLSCGGWSRSCSCVTAKGRHY